LKILIVGEWIHEMYEKAMADGFSKLGHEVQSFKWHPYFKVHGQTLILKQIETIYKKAQNKYLWGPIINRLNRDLVKDIEKNCPDALLIFRGTHIKGDALKIIKKRFPEMTVIIYNHDDPFSPDYPAWKPWRHFIDSIPFSDLVLSHRHRNFPEYFAKGAKRVELFRTWFIPERNHPITFTQQEKEKYECDVVFVGHFENDGRIKFLEEIARLGVRLKIYGAHHEWGAALSKSPELKDQVPTRLAWGAEYNKALAGGKIAMCFLSKLNRDTYATRCFEIPATGTFLLSEYTDDLASLFKEGEHVEFFRSDKEMVDKIKLYLRDDSLRKKIADAGRNWVNAEGHDAVSRMKSIINWVESLKKEKR
jgi:spore maturation protein CgeB